ncbi:MAG: Cys-tRNA(Pro) deacylase, partial [Sphingomonadales bacterium]|nr:Cys-tRNA(Pro) deacylase [Sphingomonadales bacterium]
MAQSTRATRALAAAGVTFSVHAYAYDPAAESIGQAAAAALGVSPGEVFKTLMVLADGKPACVIAPSHG